MNLLRLSASLMLAVTMLSSVSAYDMADVGAQCKKITTCDMGGVKGSTCEIANGDCPPCITFDNNGCFVKVDGKCPFGSDCGSYFTGSTSASSASTSTETTAPTSGGSKSSTGSNDSAGNPNANNTTSGSNDTENKTAGSGSSSGSDMGVVFGIIGAAIGVIAVAVIFLVLVRRSRANDDDEEEMSNTPVGMSKSNNSNGMGSSTNAVTYAPYAQRADANPTTPTNRVIQYYNDNALPSPHLKQNAGFGSSTVTAVAVPANRVRPAAGSNAPQFFKPAQPMQPQQTQYAQQQQYAPAPVQQQQYASAPVQQQQYAPAPAQQATTVPVAAYTTPEPDHRDSSPRERRESFEF